MPRGARAVRGAQVEGSYHGHSEGELLEATIPDDELLAVTCWCDTSYVIVPQYIVRWEGETFSCGALNCKSPDGDVTIGILLPTVPAVPNATRWAKKNGVKISGCKRKVVIVAATTDA